MKLASYWLDTAPRFSGGSRQSFAGEGLNPQRGFDWPAIPGHSGRVWFLPLVGAYYRLRDRFDWVIVLADPGRVIMRRRWRATNRPISKAIFR